MGIRSCPRAGVSAASHGLIDPFALAHGMFGQRCHPPVSGEIVSINDSIIPFFVGGLAANCMGGHSANYIRLAANFKRRDYIIDQ